MRVIDGKYLINIGYDFLESLKGHVPGLMVYRGEGGVVVSIRRFGVAIFDVDGMILHEPPPIMSSEIDRVAILSG